MGCNSHLSIEVRARYTHSPDRWDVWALDLPESRNYYVYEAMAGVRGEDSNAIVLPRGIPKDCSSVIEHWVKRAGEDGHTHSWLSPHEFDKVMKKVEVVEGKEWNSLNKVLITLEEIYGRENVRLVFYFDN